MSGLGALGHLGVQIAKAQVRSFAPASHVELMCQGLKVAGIDARPEPIEMVRGFKLAPDLILDATKTTAEEAVKEIVKLRPDDYDGWDGADGPLSPTWHRGIS